MHILFDLPFACTIITKVYGHPGLSSFRIATDKFLQVNRLFQNTNAFSIGGLIIRDV